MDVFEMQIKNYRLATAEIIYHMPDHPELLQSFIWQHYDIAPEFPELRRFLTFWEENIEGRVHSVKVARQELVQPSEARFARAYFQLH